MKGEKEISFVYELCKQPFIILADEQQMEQVIINVVKNGIEAIDKKGMVTFTTNISQKQLTITDNGRGIPADEIDQLFTPFFSTKTDGQGIGLTLVKEILINHGIDFSLQSNDQGQTSFNFGFVN
ncbi:MULTISPECIES: ATP-binding protein [Niastella]|uniref:histidine kinase n=1 Tax=Niastella soli TaxID=2821487 RepID=A0ABS3Z5T8_9BACT|nr:ATP-binding protein [Niastella soli]MBO9205516.1 ATP-binding protein [Niastella soli]